MWVSGYKDKDTLLNICNGWQVKICYTFKYLPVCEQ